MAKRASGQGSWRQVNDGSYRLAKRIDPDVALATAARTLRDEGATKTAQRLESRRKGR